MLQDIIPEHVHSLEEGTAFKFRCHAGVPCFTECCRELELALTPYDVLRLKNNLGLTSEQFLDRYCLVEQNPESPFPQIYLGMVDDGRGSCPFVGPDGCSVYQDRPGACRTYPLGRAAFQTPDRVSHSFHVLLTEPHCKGFTQPEQQTVDQWNEEQGLISYNAFNDLVLTILLDKKAKTITLDKKQIDSFMLALYNLEGFRIWAGHPETGVKLGPVTFDRDDDAELLKAGIHWLYNELLGE
ncbi:MAG: YkgJ family cysteine cluster protein [Proteobacteria bacterium]|nr:YkgJ family cysteine cluster protein [Pseudomonadota bacterium]